MVSRSTVVLALALCAYAAATDVSQCPDRSIDGLKDAVHLDHCKKLPCKLKKGTDQHVSITFTPEKDVTDLTNNVMAEVLGVNVPFVGVNGNSICDKIFTESGEKASCPLKAGDKYIYKDAFPILPFYPNIAVKVQWSLQDKKLNDVVCFLVSAKITG